MTPAALINWIELPEPDPVVGAVRDALRQSFAPLRIRWSPTSADSPHRARFEVYGPGWTYHHAIYLTRDGRLVYAMERELLLDDPACFEKVAADLKANLNASM